MNDGLIPTYHIDWVHFNLEIHQRERVIRIFPNVDFAGHSRNIGCEISEEEQHEKD